MYAGDETALIITDAYFAHNYAGTSGGAIRTSGKPPLRKKMLVTCATELNLTEAQLVSIGMGRTVFVWVNVVSVKIHCKTVFTETILPVLKVERSI